MRDPRYWLARAANGARKVAAGLTPWGESVWPGVRNDLFVAHQSIYAFFGRFVAGKGVLDAARGRAQSRLAWEAARGGPMTDPATYRHLPRLVFVAWLTAVLLAAPVPAPLVAWAAEPPSPEAAAIGKLLDEFIDALNTADLARYTALFAQDATAFFPMAQLPLRLEDKAQIGIVFGRLFEGMRSKGSGPKFMNLVAQDTKVQILGDVALVSFHVKGSEMVSRRTLVLVKRGGRWLILHVHASNVQISQP